MNQPKDLDKRFWEIDFLRGLALIGMIIYHLFYDLNYFNAIQIPIYNLNWFLFAHTVASSFIFIVGVSLSLSYARAKLRQKKDLTKKYVKRGIKIFSYGLVITAATYIFIPNAYIIFGVLHFIGIGIILSIPFLDKKLINILIAIPIFLIGFYLQKITINSYLLLWIGIKPLNFNTVDYFPIFPWLGVILLGIATGKILYPKYERQINLPNLSKNKAIKKLVFLGKNSLFIYFLHQPILILLLLLSGVIKPEFLL